MTIKTYTIAIEELYSAVPGKLRMSPASLLTAWEELVSDCEEGYCYGIDEFDNDLSVRDDIKLLTDAPSLQEYKENHDFRERIHAIDNRFQAITLPNIRSGENWWNTCILKQAGDIYADDTHRRFSVPIGHSNNC
jgi:hypothetical protein